MKLIWEIWVKGHRNIMELLLANGADVNAKENNGQTSLYKAVVTHQKEMLEFLLANKADVNQTTTDGETPFHYAALAGYVDIMALLASQDELNTKDKELLDFVNRRNVRGNLECWLTSGEAKEWVQKHIQGWNHNDWLELLSSLRKSRYWPMDEAQIGSSLEKLRGKHVSTAPPPPLQQPLPTKQPSPIHNAAGLGKMKWFDGYYFAGRGLVVADKEFQKFCSIIERARTHRSVEGWNLGYEVAIYEYENDHFRLLVSCSRFRDRPQDVFSAIIEATEGWPKCLDAYVFRTEMASATMVNRKEYDAVDIATERSVNDIHNEFGHEVAVIFEMLKITGNIIKFIALAQQRGFTSEVDTNLAKLGLGGVMIRGKDGRMIVNALQTEEIKTILYHGSTSARLYLYADGTREVTK